MIKSSISQKEYKIVKIIQGGNRVLKVKFRENFYCLKIQNIAEFRKEIEFHSLLENINVAPKIYDSWIDKDKGYLVTQYMNGPTLIEYLQKGKTLSELYSLEETQSFLGGIKWVINEE